MIALRVTAQWGHAKLAYLLSYGSVAACFAVNMRSITFIHATYDPLTRAPDDGRDSHECMMLGGLLRMWEMRSTGLVKFLYHQGVPWMILVFVAEVPTVITAGFHLNEGVTLITQPFAAVTLFTCATRTYRGLTDYAHEPASLNVPASAVTARFQSSE
ncbi:unnamed protein product [Peniophora sp. CBMAI 1063]|nr:unnamed protein product [Peniophora sp. CBMAI 1063]